MVEGQWERERESERDHKKMKKRKRKRKKKTTKNAYLMLRRYLKPRQSRAACIL
jgi:hypothetical protein